MRAPRADSAMTTAALAAHAPGVICAPVARPKLKVMSVMNALSATSALRRTSRITHGWMGVSAYMREMPVVRSTDSVAPSDPPTRMTPYVVIIAIIAAARFPRGLGRARNVRHAEHRVHEHGQEHCKRHVPRVKDVGQERRAPQLPRAREGGGDRSVGGS